MKTEGDIFLGDSDCRYVVATIKPWNLEAYARYSDELPGNWSLIESPEALTLDALRAINPRYIFFPHWSWKVPDAILNEYECVCFHMADVPYGRGGSPLQNLIVRGHKDTKLSALRMVADLDAGPVYCKHEMSLAGSAQQIYTEMAKLVYTQIRWLISNKPKPQPQTGEIVEFVRRKPEQSVMPKNGELAALYDHIRMLDANTYPPAIIQWGEWEIKFNNANHVGDVIEASVTISKTPKDGGGNCEE